MAIRRDDLAEDAGRQGVGVREISEEYPLTAPLPQGITVPAHVAVIMDGNGRWANAQGLPRTEGHKAGEAALMRVVAAALDLGITTLTVYAFSTENWRRSPREVRFLMGYSRDVLRRRRDQLHSWGVKVQWLGRRKRLWPSVIKELAAAQELTAKNRNLTLNMCINYGGRAEIVDAATAWAQDVLAGKRQLAALNEQTFARYLYDPQMPAVDVLWRTGGEHRTSNFLPWQASYAEIITTSAPWPQADGEMLRSVCLEFNRRERRWGGAQDLVLPVADGEIYA